METPPARLLHCPSCYFATTENDQLVRHYIKKHRDDEEFKVKCTVCHELYTNVVSFKSHYYRKHKAEGEAGTLSAGSGAFHLNDTMREEMDANKHESLDESIPTSEEELEAYDHEGVIDMLTLDVDGGTDASSESDVTSDHSSNDSSDTDDDMQDGTEGNESEVGPSQWHAAKFLLSLREEALISQSAVNEAVGGVSELFTKFSNTIKDRIMQGVDQATGTVSEEHIQGIFSEFSSAELFEGLNTKKCLDSFLKSNSDIIGVEKVTLSTTQVFSANGNVKNKEHNAFVTDFIPSLKKLLIMPDVLECVDNPCAQNDGVIRNYYDGDYCINHNTLSDPHSLAVVLCYDDLEISSPLGPRKVKLAFYYWTLANLHPHMKSSLRAISLLGIAWAKDLKLKKPQSACPSLDKKYESHCKILKNFLRDIRLLEEGISVSIHGKERVFRGTLLCVSGDCPAVAVLGGFKESVGPAHKPCHTCQVDHHEMKAIFKEEAFEPRTMESHLVQLDSLSQAKTQRDRQVLATQFGINGPPVVTGLKGFDLIKCLAFDAMHVVHEGVLKVHARLLLNYCVHEENYFTIEDINSEVARLANELLTRDKPAAIDGDHLKTGIRQSAAQMLNLAYTLPFVLMKESRLEDRLLNFVLLLQVTSGLLCYELTRSNITSLKKMIQQHHETFIVHYPFFEITPKFHYMIHLPSQILMLGPTRVTWSMRFEAMHSYFKNLMRIIKNFKNPPKSLSYRYSNLRCSQMLTLPGEKPSNYIDMGDIPGGVKSITIEEHPQRSLLKTLFSNKKTIVKSCSRLTLKGALFQTESVILYTDSDVPCFGEIKDIIIYGDIKVFIVDTLKTLEFVPQCNAFKVCKPSNSNLALMFTENLPFCQTFPRVKLANNEMYIVPKYHQSQIKDPL